ncbi:acyl-CoA thioesterase [Aeoliella mucimassa]|uniref:Acyl-CoA thioester hydrolase YbgC n=1 Tax=Aeoliella mucimassa TaxID=2527972 RepID=A0A518AR21_9BACT|nr:thioesterase family protein [Aeoliella mucimassa]QDU57165.1 Acyl-CoA thioester hydrolase YbgC [Aeoliella mucimassa]
MSHEFQFPLEVRYYETDAQGVVHHANFIKYFEVARLYHLREWGHEYADLERDGIFLVVNKIACNYRMPARFGDILDIKVRVTRARGARIDNEYMVYRDGLLIAEGSSTIACIDRQGNLQRLPEYLLMKE